MNSDSLLNFALKYEGKKIGIYGTGMGAIKVLNNLGILNQFVHCYYETKPSKEIFLNKKVLKANNENLQVVDCLIIASQYYNDIIKDLSRYNVGDIYCAFEPEKFIGKNRVKSGIGVGKYTYDTINTIDFPSNVESIGAYTSINAKASIGGKNHPLKHVSTHPMFYYQKSSSQNGYRLDGNLELDNNSKIIIGHDVWVGTNAIILPGVSIGDGAVIGAGAVVTKNIPPYAIAVGVPAKVIKYRFSSEIIAGLLKIKWWNWTDEKIEKNIELFYRPKEFVEKFINETDDN